MKQTVYACDKQVNNRPCGKPATPHALTVNDHTLILDLCEKHSPWPEWQKLGSAPEVSSKRKTLENTVRPWMPER